MATVQTQYTSPESGWVRIQETDARLVYTGTWATESNSGNSGGTARYGMNGTIHFDFKGTQLRIIGGCYSTRATAVEVYIDGVLRGTMDNSTPNAIAQVLLFSLTGLDDVDHHVEIINKESKNFMFDAIEINSGGALRAQVGSVLTQPEPGWKRYDKNTPYVKADGTWSTLSTATDKWSGDTNAKLTFIFYGSKLRYLSANRTSHPSSVKITIDGKEYIFSQNRDNKDWCIDFQLLGLEKGKHEVTVEKQSASDTSALSFSGIDIDGDGYLITQVGSQLLQPEPGWKRYDDIHPAIKYEGTGWSLQKPNDPSSNPNYNATHHQTSILGDKAIFKFYGTKVRIIARASASRATKTKITIDGITEYYSEQYSTSIQQCLVYEVLNLENKVHTVIIEQIEGNQITIDAIDIDSTGQLLHPDEVLALDELTVGKRIRAHYTATSNTMGTFSNLGEETYIDGINDFIPAASSATPNGDFYFIMVDEGNGKKKLIADRNIQHTISWDTLNNEGIPNGNKLSYTALDPTTKNSRIVLSDNNLVAKHTFNQSQEYYFGVRSVVGKSKGKWYLELKGYGWNNASLTPGVRTSIGIIGKSDSLNTTTGSGPAIPSYYKRLLIDNDSVYGLALDLDNKRMEVYRDGVLTYSEENLADQEWYPAAFTKNGTTVAFNFGQQDFVYGPPSNEYKAYDETQKSYNLITHLLTGGISSSDKDNEWDNYIVNSTLNGLITAGDNNVWNWNVGTMSWTSTISTSNSANRVSRGGSGTGVLVSNRADAASNLVNTYRGFRPVLEVEKLILSRYLVKDGEDIKTFTGQWETIGQGDITEDLIREYGMDSLAGVERHAATLTSDEIQIFGWFPDVYESRNLSAKFIPESQIVPASDDINLLSVSMIDFIALDSTLSNDAIVKILVSIDSSETWKGFREGWVDVDITDESSILNNGIDARRLAEFTPELWAQLFGDVASKKIRFLYYLGALAGGAIVEVDRLYMQVDIVGRWTKVGHGRDYNYEYTNDKIHLELYKDGDYKINY